MIRRNLSGRSRSQIKSTVVMPKKDKETKLLSDIVAMFTTNKSKRRPKQRKMKIPEAKALVTR